MTEPARQSPHQNHLLDALPTDDYERLAPHLELIPMPLGEALYESGGTLPYVYFPTTSIVSLLYVMEDGASAEIALVGNEGILGISLFMGGDTTPSRAVVQSAGHGFRLKAELLKVDAVLLAVHWSRVNDVLKKAGDLSGKAVITCSLPMNDDDTGLVIGHTSSGAEELKKRLPKARVVAAFNTVPTRPAKKWPSSSYATRASSLWTRDLYGSRDTPSRLPSLWANWRTGEQEARNWRMCSSVSGSRNDSAEIVERSADSTLARNLRRPDTSNARTNRSVLIGHASRVVPPLLRSKSQHD